MNFFFQIDRRVVPPPLGVHFGFFVIINFDEDGKQMFSTSSSRKTLWPLDFDINRVKTSSKYLAFTKLPYANMLPFFTFFNKFNILLRSLFTYFHLRKIFFRINTASIYSSWIILNPSQTVFFKRKKKR